MLPCSIYVHFFQFQGMSTNRPTTPSRPPPPSLRRFNSVPNSPSCSSNTYTPPIMQDYVLTERIGQGTYATVYKGFKKGNQREIVAVKCIKKSRLNKNSTENLFREIEILKSLDHEHIVKLKDFQWDEDNIFLILEYCSGGDLSSYIKRYRRLPEQVARKFLRQLASALSYIREKNISHMDLKPQNLLIESKYNCSLKVGDFGFAQYLLGKEGQNSLRGSPLYMAVEMFTTDTYDASVDLWSTGVILYETLFGYAPFASKTFDELEEKIVSSEAISIPAHPVISFQCKDLLQKLLQRDPKQRITFQDFFKHSFVDLEHAAGPDSLNKAIELVRRAIDCDKAGEKSQAVQWYCAAVEYFIPAVEYEKDHDKKAAIRLKIKQYVGRAEQLKIDRKKQNCPPSLNRSLSIEECAKTLPRFSDALKHAENGDVHDDNKQYDKALDEYYKGIEIMMTVLSETTKGSEAHAVVRGKTEKMISRAEEITRYRDIFAQGNYVFAGKSCCIQ